jgi:hypothetical protein
LTAAGDVQETLDALAGRLSTRSLQITRLCLERAIQHAEVRDQVGRNVTALVKAPAGRAGRPSKSLPLEQAQELLRAAGGPAPTATAVFPHPAKDTTPLPLRANVKYGCCTIWW